MLGALFHSFLGRRMGSAKKGSKALHRREKGNRGILATSYWREALTWALVSVLLSTGQVTFWVSNIKQNGLFGQHREALRDAD